MTGNSLTREPTREDYAECEEAALADHRRWAGKVVLVRTITAYYGDTCNQDDYHFDPPIAVRIDTREDRDWICNWTDRESLTTYWDVQIVDHTHLALPLAGLRSPWIFGRSYRVGRGPSDGWEFTPETAREKIARWWRNLLVPKRVAPEPE